MTTSHTRIDEMARIDAEIRTCRKCRLHETRRNAVPGEGPLDAEIMICGQAPGRNEDAEGRPFIGRAGKFLDAMLRSIGLPRGQLFITSPVKCFPPNNRPPTPDELEACRPYLKKQRHLIHPQLIIALGSLALRVLLDTTERISQLHGHPQKRDGTLIFPTFHPAAAMRFPAIRALMREDFKKLHTLLTKLKPAESSSTGNPNIHEGKETR